MGKKAAASTKKFQKRHLGRELTKRKHDQKKKAIREKSLAKYAPGEGDADGAAEGEEEEEAATGAREEEEVFSSKSKSQPARVARAAPAAASATRPAGGKPAPKKAPPIEELDVEDFMDGAFLDDDDDEEEEEGENEEDGSDEEEEAADGDAGEEEEEDGDAAALLADVEAHEAELRNLEKSDPDFFSHLKQHDKDLLRFSKDEFTKPDADDDEDDDAGDAVDSEDEEEPLEVLTWESLVALKRSVMAPVLSLKGLKKFVRVFRTAVHIGSVGDGKKKSGAAAGAAEKEEDREKEARFRADVAIHSPKVFQEIIRFAIKEMAAVWGAHFKQAAAPAAKAAATAGAAAPSAAPLDKHPRWSHVGPSLKSYLGHLLFFLSTLRSNTSQAPMARFVLGGLESLMRLFEPFPRLAQKLLKELLELWATSERNVRIDAFLRIRQLAIELTGAGGASNRGGENLLELALKGAYLTYVRHTKFTSHLNLPVIDFMANCVVELYGLDPLLAYQHAFVYIRQMAIHLRQAVQVKKKDAHRAVYNWNFVNSLRVWSKVLAAHGGSSSSTSGVNGAVAAADNLQALVYPFVQICLGTLTVLPSSRYFPLRFHVCRFLIHLMSRCRIFIPLAPHLLAVFHAPELQRKPTAGKRKASDIAVILKASQQVIATKPYQESVVSEALHLLLEYFALFSYSIAFNELILPSVKLLKRQGKDIVIQRIRKQLAGFVLKLEHNASWIASQRAACNWAPKDLAGDGEKGVDAIDTFRQARHGDATSKATKQQQSPMDKYVQVQMEEKKRIDEAHADWDGSQSSRLSAESKRKKKSKSGSESDEEGEEDEEGEGEGAEGGEDDEEGDEQEEEDDDDDAPPRKKSKPSPARARSAAPAAAAAAVSLEDAGEGDDDQLEVMQWSDDEDSTPKRKNKSKGSKQMQKKASKPHDKQSNGQNRKRKAL